MEFLQSGLLTLLVFWQYDPLDAPRQALGLPGFSIKPFAARGRFISARTERLPTEIAKHIWGVGNLCLYFRAHPTTSKGDGLKTRRAKF
jgi:hypothetical protein